MKIALVSMHFSEYAFRLSQALAERHDVLLCINEKNFKDEVSEQTQMTCHSRCTIVRLPNVWLKNPLLFLKGFHALKKAICQFDPCVMHCQEAVRDYLMAALLFLPRYPTVLTIHDHVPHTGQDSRHSARVKLYRSYLRQKADFSIVHGERIRSETEELMPWLKQKLVSIPHGILGDSFNIPPATWNNGTLLFFGRIEEYKGLPYLIEAIQLLENEGVQVRVIVAGTGSGLARHKAYLQCHDRFELVARYIQTDEIPSLFARSDIVVMPYTDATQSGVAALALNYHRPIIASDVGSIREIVRDGYNGLLVPPRNSRALADAIKTMVLDRAKLMTMSSHASLLAQGEYSWKSISEHTERAYERAMRQRMSGGWR